MSDNCISEPYEVILGNRRYMCTKVGDTEVSVRIPLHVWDAPTEPKIAEYTDELIRRAVAEARRQNMWPGKVGGILPVL